MEVNMDILELKALEKKIADLTAEKAELISREKQVVVYHKYFNGRLKLNSGAKSGQNIQITGYRRVHDYGPFRGIHDSMDYFSDNFDVADAIRQGWLTIDLSENTTKTTKDYENLSEIVKDIHEEEKLAVQEELLKAQLRASQAEQYSATVDDKCTKQILELKAIQKKGIDDLLASRQKEIDEDKRVLDALIATKNAAYEALSQKFEDFKTDKQRLTLEQQLAEVIAELKAEKAKPWYKKLFK